MPPVIDVASLSDEDLQQKLIEFGVDVGPVNVATRSTYERKLVKLLTGQTPAKQHSFEPVPDDDDEEVQLRVPATSTPSSRPGPPPSALPSAIPVPTETRSRRDFSTQDQSPLPKLDRVDYGRPSLSTASARKFTAGDAGFTPTRLRPGPAAPRGVAADDASPATQPKRRSGGIPAWVKLLLLGLTGVLVYLIYSNMEPAGQSNIPSLPDKVEV